MSGGTASDGVIKSGLEGGVVEKGVLGVLTTPGVGLAAGKAGLLDGDEVDGVKTGPEEVLGCAIGGRRNGSVADTGRLIERGNAATKKQILVSERLMRVSV